MYSFITLCNKNETLNWLLTLGVSEDICTTTNNLILITINLQA